MVERSLEERRSKRVVLLWKTKLVVEGNMRIMSENNAG